MQSKMEQLVIMYEHRRHKAGEPTATQQNSRPIASEGADLGFFWAACTMYTMDPIIPSGSARLHGVTGWNRILIPAITCNRHWFIIDIACVLGCLLCSSLHKEDENPCCQRPANGLPNEDGMGGPWHADFPFRPAATCIENHAIDGLHYRKILLGKVMP